MKKTMMLVVAVLGLSWTAATYACECPCVCTGSNHCAANQCAAKKDAKAEKGATAAKKPAKKEQKPKG